MERKEKITGFIHSPGLREPIYFEGEPVYEKVLGIYGFLIPVGDRVFFIWSDEEGLRLEEPEGWFFVKENKL